MQNIVIDKPYRFVAPDPSNWLVRFFLARWLPHNLRRNYGVEQYEYRGTEHLRQSLAAGHGIVLAPNHSRPCDPLVMGMLGLEVGRPNYTMASWHLFTEGRFRAWLLRQAGGFSVYREGMDREALKAATNILVEAHRPLVMFSEGIVTRTNDRLNPLQEGPAFLARTAAKQRAKLTPPGQVVIHPVAIKYFFGGDLMATVGSVLDEVETRLSWQPQRHVPLVDRITKLGEALLTLKEIEYLGRAQAGSIPERQAHLIDRVLGPLEKEWLKGRAEPTVVERVKRLRIAILPDMVAGDITEEERSRRWRQLADIYLAQQISLYPADYVRSRPTPERVLETVERFEEDLTDVARCHRPLRVVIQVGDALPVSAERERGKGEDPLMTQLAERLQTMLDGFAAESTVLPGSETAQGAAVHG
jgi:1-acyl-sn-glycerol-3-phosphate acyltransferase